MAGIIIKGIIGILLIVMTYYGTAKAYGASFEGLDGWSMIVEYSFLLLLSITNLIQIKKLGGTIPYLIWLGVSIIPGIKHMRDMRFREKAVGGWISFPWDWTLWLSMSIIYTFSQIIFLVGVVMYRKYKKNKQNGN